MALYYHNAESQIPNIIDTTLNLIENGRLTAIGVYSSEIVNATYEPSGYREVLAGPIELVNQIAKSPKAQKQAVQVDDDNEAVLGRREDECLQRFVDAAFAMP